jgi:hypothetical protein
MEDDDIPVHDLLGIGGEPEPGPDELRAIVARAGRKRWAISGVAAALALALGLGIGFATSGGSTPSSQTATAGSASGQNTPGNAAPSAGTGSGTSSGGAAPAVPKIASPERLIRLFTRTSGGVTIRGFLVSFPQIFGAPVGCQVGGGSHLQAEVSTASMVGIVGGGLVAVDRSQPVSAVSSQLVGTAEGDSTAVVIAATGPGVADVSMSFADGATDAMAPVQGWVALAARVGSALSYGSNLGTLTERNAAGKVLNSHAVQLGLQSSVTFGSSCRVTCTSVRPQAGVNAKSTTPNSASASSGSAQIGVVCPPLPCPSVPRLTVPPEQTPTTTGSTTGKPGGPTVSSAGSGAATRACALPASPSRGAPSSSGAPASP